MPRNPSADRKRAVTICGQVKDVFFDDVDTEFLHLTLQTPSGITYACYRTKDIQADFLRLKKLLGCEIRFTTIAPAYLVRKVVGPIYDLRSIDNIDILSVPKQGPFDVPTLSSDPPSLVNIDTCGPRKTKGTVLGRWRGDSFLLRTDDGDALKVQLRDRNLPPVGAPVEVVGALATDLYRYNFVQAQWRLAEPPLGAREAPAQDIPMKELFFFDGHPVINQLYHGVTVRLKGVVKAILSDETGKNRLLIDDESHKLIVDCSALPEVLDLLSEGDTIQVTGVGVIESDYWHSGNIFPKVSGIFLLPRTADDIVVLGHPPWWTPARLVAVVFGLLALLVVILIWNAALRALVARKSRTLLREQAETLSKTLKIDERTRLAAELHDYLAQNLTAVAYQVSAVQASLDGKNSTASDGLKAVAQLLDTCRVDLRRCLWDLKSNVLDEPDFALAIRKTVLPVAAKARLTVRFAGLRSHISDSTAHTVLSILRELVANAVNHGHAPSVRIAGEQRQGLLRFSVADDGIGFDPATLSAAADGHFGLNGICERLRHLNGRLEIESAPGRGTHIRVTIDKTSTFQNQK